MGYVDLAYAIVEQAVEDYRKRKLKNKPVADLVRFFKGNWCAILLDSACITGEEIYQQLKSETQREI